MYRYMRWHRLAFEPWLQIRQKTLTTSLDKNCASEPLGFPFFSSGKFDNEQFTYVNNTLQSYLSGAKYEHWFLRASHLAGLVLTLPCLLLSIRCIGVDSNNQLQRENCDGSDNQYWIYDTSTQQVGTADSLFAGFD